MTDPAPSKPSSDPRSVRKRRAILDAATEVFLAEGFAGASMDAIAAAAGVSKPTVYNHFADKQELFAQIVHDMIGGITEPFYDQLINLSDTDDIQQDLHEVAMLLLTGVMQARNLQLRRLVIGEASRFPELGRAYEQQGPDRAIAALARTFERLDKQGKLRVEDPVVAAAHFNWLVLSTSVNHAMLSGDDRTPGRTALQRYTTNAVRVFLAAYSGGDLSSPIAATRPLDGSRRG